MNFFITISFLFPTTFVLNFFFELIKKKIYLMVVKSFMFRQGGVNWLFLLKVSNYVKLNK